MTAEGTGARRGLLYLGMGVDGPTWAPAQQSVLALGPPRSGKTSALVVPTVLGAEGPVVSTSTKPDVLSVTAPSRTRLGNCLLFDPSGTVPVPAGVRPVRWSPVPGCRDWDHALTVTRALVGASRATAAAGAGTWDHWSERAEALLGPLLHAAALSGESMGTVLAWVDRRQLGPATRVLDEAGATIAADVLSGIAATDQREQSGVWSTASGVVAAYRSTSALESTRDPDFDPQRFCASSSTLYVCATGRHQALAAPLVVGLLTEIRAAAYARATAGVVDPPVVMALDEVANIAPIPDLPAMVSEGGGQGVVTLACLQDLSQARQRWGPAADGFFSLFGTTVVLAGIGDLRTLEVLSALAGEHDVATRSLSKGLLRPGLGGVLLAHATGGRAGLRPSPSTVTTATRRQARLSVDEIARGRKAAALTVDERNGVGWVGLTPWFSHEPWRGLVRAREPGRHLGGPRLSGREPAVEERTHVR